MNIRDESITHYDRYGKILSANNNHETETRFLEYLHRCKILDTNVNKISKINWKIVKSNSNVAHQSDTYSCGCYVIYYMEVIAKNSMNSKENCNPDFYRIEIVQFLIQNSLPLNKICLGCANNQHSVQFQCSKCHRCVHTGKCRKIFFHDDCICR